MGVGTFHVYSENETGSGGRIRTDDLHRMRVTS
jgi:hypothetical protein